MADYEIERLRKERDWWADEATEMLRQRNRIFDDAFANFRRRFPHLHDHDEARKAFVEFMEYSGGEGDE